MKKLLFLLCLPFAISAQSPLPAMLLDINPGTANTTFGQFSDFGNGKIVFSVSTFSSSTKGLWATDATTLGTIQLRQFSFNVAGFTDYGSRKYISAPSGAYLWRTDGTIAGTDSIPLPGVSSIGEMVVCNNLLFFVATSAASGTELWRTDGTPAGSFMVKDIGPGATNGLGVKPIAGVYNNLLFFRANDNVSGEEMWTSDGTTVGTNLITDIFAGSGASNPNKFSVGNNGVYFTAYTPATGTELWFTNGQAANTVMLQDVETGTASATPGELYFINNYAYYFYGRRLFRSDGTAVGTTTLAIPVPTTGNSSYEGMVEPRFRLCNNELYYLYVRSFIMPGPTIIRDTLYFGKVNPSFTTTSIVMKNNINNSSVTNILYSPVIHVNNSHFVLYLAPLNRILILNPVAMTQHEYQNIQPGGSISLPRVINNKLYYPHGSNGNDIEPGYVDLNNDSLYRISNVNPSGSSTDCGIQQNIIHYIYQVNGYNYIVANHPSYGAEFWQTDLTDPGTTLLLDIYPGANNYNTGLTITGGCQIIQGIQTSNNMFFSANNNINGLELWCFVQPSSTVTAIGQNPEAKAATVDVFPNPSTAQLNIRCSSEMNSIEVFNSLGVLVRQKAISGAGEQQIDISGLPVGMYVVSVKTTSGIVSRKIVKAD